MASNETKNPRRAQMRGPGGPGGAMTGEKAKDFKQAVKRLLKELKGYKVLIIISLILAIAGAVLSISAPNKLSELTDEIQKGLIIQAMDLDKIKAIAIFAYYMIYSVQKWYGIEYILLIMATIAAV